MKRIKAMSKDVKGLWFLKMRILILKIWIQVKKHGVYMFDEPTCSECGKGFLVVPHYMMIDAIDLWNGEHKELESAYITAFERREKELRYIT